MVADSMFSVTPIGYIRTPYRRKYDAPRQPRIDDRVDDAVVELLPHKNFEQALADLEGCQRVWLITWMHKAIGWKPRIQTPRDRTKRGVFATRSPHRPNPIGLTCVELISVKGRVLKVRGTDLLDGSPILDIKPYVAYADSFPDSSLPWVDGLTDVPLYVVVWPDSAQPLDQEQMSHVMRVLSFDPLPHPYRRITSETDGTYTLAVQEHRIHYRIDNNKVIVL